MVVHVGGLQGGGRSVGWRSVPFKYCSVVWGEYDIQFCLGRYSILSRIGLIFLVQFWFIFLGTYLSISGYNGSIYFRHVFMSVTFLIKLNYNFKNRIARRNNCAETCFYAFCSIVQSNFLYVGEVL